MPGVAVAGRLLLRQGHGASVPVNSAAMDVPHHLVEAAATNPQTYLQVGRPTRWVW